MTISSLSGYASLLSLQASQTNSTSTTSASANAGTASSSASGSGTVDDQLLSMLRSIEASNGTSTDPLLQDSVTLSPAALGQASSAEPQTYDAKGLLKQIQNSMVQNDPLLSDTSGDTSSTDNPLF
jgi:hypothetical protein